MRSQSLSNQGNGETEQIEYLVNNPSQSLSNQGNGETFMDQLIGILKSQSLSNQGNGETKFDRSFIKRWGLNPFQIRATVKL